MLLVVNNESLSPVEELVQDIISILHVFSCRIYGLRKYKKRIQEDEEMGKVNQKLGAEEKARKMLIDGEDWDKIREETKLRQKDLKRIQQELTERF